MYFMSSIDNNSKKVWVYTMKKAEVESKFGRSCLKSENVIEFKDGEFLKFYEKHDTNYQEVLYSTKNTSIE